MDEARRFEDTDIEAQRQAECPSLREECPETEADVVESGEADCPVCGLSADDHPAQLPKPRADYLPD